MEWQQLKVRLSPPAVDSCEDIVFALGALSVSYLDAEDQPVFQIEIGSTPLWDEIFLCALFNLNTNMQGVIDALKQSASAEYIQQFSITAIQDQDWKSVWIADFKPMRFGRRLWICPSWTKPPVPTAVNILLDPGLAFGTGTHATTALCLEWLDQAELGKRRVIDYGCGSGVLAIAAVLLGASDVRAVDNDPQAITASETNRDHNHIPPAKLPCFLPDDMPREKADVIIANILAAPLHELAELFASLLPQGGEVVLSGLIENQVDDLMHRYSSWFDMESPVLRDGWARLTGRRR